MNAIELNGISKKYKDFQLKNISFTLPSGCILGLVGENGAGKSTIIKSIMGAIKTDSGSVRVFDTDNSDPSFTQLKNDIGVVLDEAYFPETITAENVNAIMKYTYKNWDEKEYFSLIERFSLPLKKAFKEFSRGMKMKLAIAVALSHKARLLVLDEPTSGLDPIIRDEILDVFNEFTREATHSVLISSHIISDLEKICDYVAFVHKGELLVYSDKDSLLERYAIVRLTREQFEAVEPSAVISRKDTSYGVEALVERKAVAPALVTEHISLEEIILYLARSVG